MANAYIGNILRVDLSKGKIAVENPDERFYRTYIGGRTLIAYYLLKELAPGIDPLGPQNKLIFAPGILTGIPVPGTSRHSIGAKSPLTGGFAESESGGYWGAELKRAGFDAVIVEGQSPKPVYLWIRNGKAELRDASSMWGKDIVEAEEMIRAELGDDRIRTAQIGIAGENLVRMACIMNDRVHAAGRTGLGAVMGSKRLRAIAVRGTKPVPVADAEALKALAKFVLDSRDKWEGFKDTGQAGIVPVLNLLGGLPTRNFQAGSMPEADQLGGEAMRDTILVGRDTCYACPIHCKREVSVEETDYRVDPAYGGPEYETIGALGSNLGISDLKAVSKGNELCGRYGLDTISAGNVIGFVMECLERGVLKESDLGGLKLKFGDPQSMLQGIEAISRRQGFGDRMAEGVKRLADSIGPAAQPLALHVKGQEVPMHDPRIKWGQGLGYAVSPTGADHVLNIHDTGYAQPGPFFDSRLRAVGILDPVKVDDLSPAKVRVFVYDVNFWGLDDSLLLCTNLRMVYDHNKTAEIVRAATGWNSTVLELWKVGERSINLARAFNVREGFKRADDTIPERFFEAILDSNTGKPLDKKQFEQALSTYYCMMGWDEQGVPTRCKLQELGIEWVADELAQ